MLIANTQQMDDCTWMNLIRKQAKKKSRILLIIPATVFFLLQSVFKVNIFKITTVEVKEPSIHTGMLLFGYFVKAFHINIKCMNSWAVSCVFLEIIYIFMKAAAVLIVAEAGIGSNVKIPSQLLFSIKKCNFIENSNISIQFFFVSRE